MPRIAPHLPVAVPVPVGVGVPGQGYPWPWSVYRWVLGRNPEPGEADLRLAGELADFVRALRGVDTFGLTAEGPLRSYRADPIQLRDTVTRACIDDCAGLLDTVGVVRAWEQARRVAEFTGPPVWMHADLHPGNLLVRDGHLAAVLDWGGLALGDPALDCLVAWTLLSPLTRPTFRPGSASMRTLGGAAALGRCRSPSSLCPTTPAPTRRSRGGPDTRFAKSSRTSSIPAERRRTVEGCPPTGGEGFRGAVSSAGSRAPRG